MPPNLINSLKGLIPSKMDEKTIALARRMIEENMVEILSALIDSAIGGNLYAGKALLDKVLPDVKPVQRSIHLKALADGSLSQQAERVYMETIAGSLTPEQAAALMQVLRGRADIDLTDPNKSREPVTINVKYIP